MADGEVFARGYEVVALEQHARDPDMHVRRPAQRLGSPLRGREVEGALVGVQGVGQPALGPADVPEGDATAEDVGEKPGLLQARDGLGVGGVGAGQVTRCPRHEPGQRAA